MSSTLTSGPQLGLSSSSKRVHNQIQILISNVHNIMQLQCRPLVLLDLRHQLLGYLDKVMLQQQRQKLINNMNNNIYIKILQTTLTKCNQFQWIGSGSVRTHILELIVYMECIVILLRMLVGQYCVCTILSNYYRTTVT